VIDKDKLLARLEDERQTQIAVVGSIYKGLAERVRRGDFDVDEPRKEEPDAEGQTPVYDVPERLPGAPEDQAAV
jgi:hypothetical protein